MHQISHRGAPAPFIFHLPAKSYSCVVKRRLCDHFPHTASIFFSIIPGGCLHSFIGDGDPLALLAVSSKRSHVRRSKEAAGARMISSCRKAGFISQPLCLRWRGRQLAAAYLFVVNIYFIVPDREAAGRTSDIICRLGKGMSDSDEYDV